jgi:hypothetical protein
MKIDDIAVTQRGHICKVIHTYDPHFGYRCGPDEVQVFRARGGLPTANYKISSLRLATVEDAKADFLACKNKESRRWIRSFAREIGPEGVTV